MATGDLRRGAPGTALRGHLVPDALHRQARSRKVELRARLGRRVTWDHVVQSGLAMLVEEPELAPAMLDELRRTTDDSSRRRLVQATLSTELDRRLIELQLELSSRSERSVTYEQLWAAAVQLWLRSTA